MRGRSTVIALIVSASACQLTETLIAPGERTLVVQSVIDRTQVQQFAVLGYVRDLWPHRRWAPP